MSEGLARRVISCDVRARGGPGRICMYRGPHERWYFHADDTIMVGGGGSLGQRDCGEACATYSSLVAITAATSSGGSSLNPLESPTKMSDEEGREPLQLGKRTLDAIIEGVVAKLRESPPEKRFNDGAGSSGADKGE